MSDYNDQANLEHLDLRKINVCEDDPKTEADNAARTDNDGNNQVASRSMEMGRWYSWAVNQTTGKTHSLVQRVSKNFVVTRDHKYLVGEDDFRANHADTGNDKIYNADAVAANHVIGNPVFDADPSYTMSSIISYGGSGTFDPDTVNLKQNAPYTRALTADPGAAQIPAATDFFSDLDGPHITITVPKKVRIRSETADVTPEIRTVCE